MVTLAGNAADEEERRRATWLGDRSFSPEQAGAAMIRLVSLRDLEVMVARLDLALERAGLAPGDPVARHELDFCLGAFASQVLPKGLGEEIRCLVRQARDLATAVPCPRGTALRAPSDGEASGRLRSMLLDIAAAISVREGDAETSYAVDGTQGKEPPLPWPGNDPLRALPCLEPTTAATRRPVRNPYGIRHRAYKRQG
jgi:hypothetical protein